MHVLSSEMLKGSLMGYKVYQSRLEFVLSWWQRFHLMCKFVFANARSIESCGNLCLVEVEGSLFVD
jgi:hypothetical protein